jgi:hypothetical protein
MRQKEFLNDEGIAGSTIFQDPVNLAWQTMFLPIDLAL